MFMTDLNTGSDLIGYSTDLNTRLGLQDSEIISKKVYENDDESNAFMSPNPFEVAQDFKSDEMEVQM